MEHVLDLQNLESADTPEYGGPSHGGGASNLSLIASCANSTVSLLTCH
ncbi:SapB/AmfS family lanthipeptide [Amycolatopsis cihanbeyliensis]|uniref:SapB/AmfS family lantipeptide n=1 Tax=Amycolatopsis cihanbeyliensis TaxID=1128664 RepID=A0A542DK39_AMYCI|nr:SapB/AmfS family lanthipeptide [Amycolatopsis cihanbeyliensis]TQJ03446.1 hypothetical protein FB471_3206 [Amycolatopsis cihanbeyliensis]